MKIPGILAAALFAVSAASSVEAAHWVQATPFGGYIGTALAQAPSAPQILYTVAWPGRFFRSSDGGASWSPSGANRWDLADADLLVDPHDPRTVYAWDGSQSLLRTRDSGRTWTPIGGDLIFWDTILAADAGQTGLLYATTQGGLYRSTDRGDTWSLAAFAGTRVVTLAEDPHDPASWLAVVVGPEEWDGPAGVWKSADHGATWTEISRLQVPWGLDFTSARAVFDPSRLGALYLVFLGTNGYSQATSSGPVARSTDGGVSWAELPAALGILDLAVAPDGALFAAIEYGGISRSTDYGETWSPRLPDISWKEVQPRDATWRILASAAAPGSLLAAGSAGLWRSGDGGASWEDANQGITGLSIYELAVAPVGPSSVVVQANNSTYRSTDQGTTWTRVHSALDGPQPYTLEAVAPRRPPVIYGIGSDVEIDIVVQSTDAGSSWTRVPMPYGCNGGSPCSVGISLFALDPDRPDTLFVGGSYFFHYGGSGDFLVRRDDGSATWTELTPLRHLRTLALDPERSETLYAATCGKLYKSNDGGRFWRRVGRGLPWHLCPGASWNPPPLVFDPRDSRKLYLGTDKKGVFVSTDGGETFRAMSHGLESLSVVTLLLDPADPDHLYAGAGGKGVFQWSAKRKTWTPLNQGLPTAVFTGALALDPRQPRILYAGTGRGLFRLDLDAPNP